MRKMLVRFVLLGLLAGCSSSDRTAERDVTTRTGSVHAERERIPEREFIAAILDRLSQADAAPDVAALTLVLSAGPSDLAFDDVRLTLWHEPATGSIWVRQSAGYPGTDLWFGPGPDAWLPRTAAPRPAPFTALTR